MTKEEKQLLLKDLCARVPYGVKVKIASDGGMMEVSYNMTLDLELLNDLIENGDDFKPYLRPISSMTKEENKEYHNLCYDEERECYEFGEWTTRIYFHDTIDSIDWLLAHHFDYRGLIKKDLALEAPEDMYKEE